MDTPERPWKSIEIDVLCGLPDSIGYTVIMVIVDRFSKMIHLIPFKQIPDAKQAAKAFMNNIFKLHGLPQDIYTDRGSQFTSALWNEFMHLLKIKNNIATTDHHETVGQVDITLLLNNILGLIQELIIIMMIELIGSTLQNLHIMILLMNLLRKLLTL